MTLPSYRCSTPLVRLISGTALACAALLSASSLLARSADTACPETRYTITDLGPVPAATSGFITALNESGSAAGYSQAYSADTGASCQATAWYTTGATNLGADGQATGINDRGDVVGYAYGDAPQHAFLYSQGKMKNLGTLGGSTSMATGINDSGVVVGQSDVGGAVFHAFIWTAASGMKDLNSLLGAPASSEATAINRSGQIAGIVGCQQAYLYDPTRGVTLLGWLPGHSASIATALNNKGEVVGASLADCNNAINRRAFLWDRDHGMRDLGTLGSYPTQANGINDLGQIVGQSPLRSGAAPHAFIWQQGAITDLNRLIPHSSGWTLQAAVAVNNRGQIAGYGRGPAGPHAFLLTPVKTS